MPSFWQALTILKLPSTFSVSVLFVFLKFSTESKFFFILIILGCWSNIFVAIDNDRLLIALESTALLFYRTWYFQIGSDFWKIIIENVTQFSIVWDIFNFFSQFFSLFECLLYWKTRNYLLSLILLMFKLLKYDFLVALKSFLQ